MGCCACTHDYSSCLARTDQWDAVYALTTRVWHTHRSMGCCVYTHNYSTCLAHTHTDQWDAACTLAGWPHCTFPSVEPCPGKRHQSEVHESIASCLLNCCVTSFQLAQCAYGEMRACYNL
eukprot:scaffold122242_cov22-Tisochrysis_lutea.AAC.1